MIATFLTLCLFSIHVSPYFQLEKSFLRYNCEDTVYTEPFQIVFKQEDIFALGATLEEEYLWIDLSFGGVFFENIISYIDINTGAKWKYFTNYIGYLFPIRSKKDVSGSNSIYAGIAYYYRAHNSTIGFDVQLRKEYFVYSISRHKVDSSYVSTFLTSKISYELKFLNPFIYISLNTNRLSEPLSLKVGFGITYGKPPFVLDSYKTIKTHQWVYPHDGRHL